MLTSATLPLVVLLGCHALAPYSPGACAFRDIETCQQRGDALVREFDLPDPLTCEIQVGRRGLPV